MTQRIKRNFETLNLLLTEFQNNMNSGIPEIYSKIDQKDDSDLDEVILANFLWNTFEFIPDIEILDGGNFIFLILSAFLEDVRLNLSDYPDLNVEINSVQERLHKTINCIKVNKILPVIVNTEDHYNDIFTFSGVTFKISDFDLFDFVYDSESYNECLNKITRIFKSKIFNEYFPYDKWQIGFWCSKVISFNPCVRSNLGCDGCDDLREFVEDINQPILDGDGNILAHDAYEWMGVLSKDNHKFYVLEPISAPNVRFGEDKDSTEYKTKYPNGAFVNEYCLISMNNNSMNDCKLFDDEIGKWMFFDDSSDTIINSDGFVGRPNFYMDRRLDRYNSIWKYKF